MLNNRRGFVWPIIALLYEVFMLAGFFIAKVIEKLSVGQSW